MAWLRSYKWDLTPLHTQPWRHSEDNFLLKEVKVKKKIFFFAVNFEFKANRFIFIKEKKIKEKRKGKKRVLMYCSVIRLSLVFKQNRV